MPTSLCTVTHLFAVPTHCLLRKDWNGPLGGVGEQGGSHDSPTVSSYLGSHIKLPCFQMDVYYLQELWGEPVCVCTIILVPVSKQKDVLAAWKKTWVKSPSQLPYVSILQEQPLRRDRESVSEGFVWVLSATLCAVTHNTTVHTLVIRVYPATEGTSQRTFLEGADTAELLLLTTCLVFPSLKV